VPQPETTTVTKSGVIVHFLEVCCLDHLAGIVSSKYYQTKIKEITATLSRLGIRADPNITLCITYPMAIITKESLVRMMVCVQVITT